MNIELVGIPGVGKSYLCRSVEFQLQSEKDRGAVSPLPLTTPWMKAPYAGHVTNTVRKIVGATVFACCHPRTTRSLQKLVFGQGQKIQRNRTTKFINLLSEMQRLHAAGAKRSLMTEQGVLQGVWSLEMLASTTICEQLMELIIPWLPDAIVVVKAETSQLEQQLAFRELGQSTFDQLRGRKLSLAIRRGEENMARILELWARLKPEGRRLDFHNEPDNDAAILFSWLSTQVRGS